MSPTSACGVGGEEEEEVIHPVRKCNLLRHPV
jgi:hypothetical protein